ncbi:MAG: Fic family protein [Rhodovibrionaceae bacterium]
MSGDAGDRHSHADSAQLITNPKEIAEREALNGLRQFDAGMESVETYLDPERPFKLRLSLILELHRCALEGISAYAGNFRPGGVEIKGSAHEPIGAHLVAANVEDLCDYVNDNWTEKSALHLAAYVLWRLNWIHPFADGNGRTSRILSYVVLCLKLGYKIPGTRTIPDQISENKNPYYEALDDADAHAKEGHIDTSKLEELLSELLAAQLLSIVEEATGKPTEM